MENIVTIREVRIAEKELLTLEEASCLFGIGINKLREISDAADCKFVLYVGRKRLIKKRQFLDYIKFEYSI